MLFSILPSFALSLAFGATLPAQTTIHADSGDAQIPLTVAALSDMATFWTDFLKEPPSVRQVKRRSLSIPLPDRVRPVIEKQVGKIDSVRLPVPDMRAIAEKYPSVVADLARAHLTIQKWEQYRLSLLTAWQVDVLDSTTHLPSALLDSATAQSVIWRNVAFLRAHPKEFEALKETTEWFSGFRRLLPIVGEAFPQLTVHRWLNGTLEGGGRPTFGDGHIYVLNFMSHWCDWRACPPTYSNTDRAKTLYAAQGVRVLYVTKLWGFYDSLKHMPATTELDSLKQYIAEHQLMAPVLVADNGLMFKYVWVYPSVLIIDGAGKVRSSQIGGGLTKESIQILKELIASSAPHPQKGP